MINLEQWINGSTSQRQEWIAEFEELDSHSKQILLWAEAFKSHGATITDFDMLRLYRSGQLA